MKTRFALGIVFTLLLVYILASPALAVYYTYRAEDPSKQDASFNGVENHVFRWWWIDSAFTLVWWADPALYLDAVAAKNEWTYYIPFIYAEALNEESATLKFKDMACPGLSTASACLRTNSYYVDATLKANYLLTATIYVNPTPYACCPLTQKPWSDWGRKRMMTRELGSFYGLQERDIQPNEQCNDNELTIMDGVKVKDDKIEHCDETSGPQLPDRSRVEAYWGKPDDTNRRTDITVTGWSVGPIGYFTWKDMAWAEAQHRVFFEYFNGSSWEEKHFKDVILDIGTHFRTEDRQIRWDGDRRNYSGVPGWYRLCVVAYSAAYAPAGYLVAGPVRCSNLVYLQ